MNISFYRVVGLAAAASAAALLAACSTIDVPKVPGVTPYRMEIQQGNYISQEMVEQLKPGMTREQVRFILGTPLVTDLFHANRWDFVFFRERPNGKREQRNLSVIFADNKLIRVVGDLLPSDAVKPAAAAFPSLKPSAEASKPAEEAKEERGFFGRLIDSVTPAKAAEAKPEAKPAAEVAPQVEKPAETATVSKEAEHKPEEEKKDERGFFGRMRDKLGL